MSDVFTRCDLCDKSFSGPEPYAEHLYSKGHQKKMNEAVPNRYAIKDTNTNGQYYCKDCSVSLSGPEPYKQHTSGSKHLAVLKKKSIMSGVKNLEEDDSIKHIDIGDENALSCRVCSKAFSGPESLKQHIESKKHARKVQVADLSQRINSSGQPTCPGMERQSTERQTNIKNIEILENMMRAEGKMEQKKPTGCLAGFAAFFKKGKQNKKEPKKKKK